MRYRLLLSLVALGILLPGAVAAQDDTRPGVAVFPFYNGGSYGRDAQDLAAMEVGLQQLFITELAMSTSLRVVERSALRELLAEQDLGAAGRVDANTAARMGRLVGARYAVLGGFIEPDRNRFSLNARIVDTETGEIVRADRLEGRRERIYELVMDLSSRLTDGVHLPALTGAARDEPSDRQLRQLPEEAIQLFSRAQIAQDVGNDARAIELYSQITQRFPAMTAAREALRQLQGG